jgi:O-methyltransferase
MGKRLRNAINGVLRPLNVSVVRGSTTKTWSHPRSPEISHSMVLPNATYSPWLDDQEFIRCFDAVRRHTLVDIYRCHELWLLGKQLGLTEGEFLEVGVWRGGTGALLASSIRSTAKRIFLADTFSGVVKAGDQDSAYSGGEHADTSESLVRDLLASLGLANAVILKGTFPEDTADRAPERIALLHCDVDVYESAKDIVDWAVPRLSMGSVIVFDDYGFSGCEGVTRLVNELRLDPRFRFIHNLNGHALLIRVG